MKKLTIALVLLALIIIVGCQAPQDMKAQLDKQAETIKNLETKVTEQAVMIEQMKMDFEKLLTELQKQKVITKTTTQSTPQPPTRVGR